MLFGRNKNKQSSQATNRSNVSSVSDTVSTRFKRNNFAPTSYEQLRENRVSKNVDPVSIRGWIQTSGYKPSRRRRGFGNIVKRGIKGFVKTIKHRLQK